MVLSKRLLIYDTRKADSMNNQLNDKLDDANSANPIHCELNYYYLNITVMTQQEIRVYNCKDGKLEKIISNL